MNENEMNEDLALRRMLWLHHGCSVAALYGDDGEMSCGACRIDFKRMNPILIDKMMSQARSMRLRVSHPELFDALNPGECPGSSR